MSFLGNWRSHDAVMDGLGAQPFVVEARMVYDRIGRMSRAQLRQFNARIERQYALLPPHLQRVVDQVLERNPSFDPRALHGLYGYDEVEGLGWAQTVGTIAQAAATIGGVALAYKGQQDARKDAARAASQQHQLEQQKLMFAQQQAQQQLELQKMMMEQNRADAARAAQAQRAPGAAGGSMSDGTKKALLIGGAAAAAGAVALAVAK